MSDKSTNYNTENCDKLQAVLNLIENVTIVGNLPITSTKISEKLKFSHQIVISVLTGIASRPNFIDVTRSKKYTYSLTKEGETIVNDGSYEYNFFKLIDDNGTFLSHLKKHSVTNVGLKWALKNKWVSLKKQESDTLVVKNVKSCQDGIVSVLHQIKLNCATENDVKIAQKRKLVERKEFTIFSVIPAANFSAKLKPLHNDLTINMLHDDSWENVDFKSYNFSACGLKNIGGNLHPLLKMRAHYRDIFLRMGFSENYTNQFVESSFWNFDALFQPQQHPSRDLQDTFFLLEPQKAIHLPKKCVEMVKKVHSVGDFGSEGYKYDWKLSEAEKLILRTHTTANTTKMLYNIAQKEIFEPAKIFSIDRVFRNETLDSTHLAEFHQIEGVVVDYNLSLGNLMGYISHFFKQLGLSKLRYKPAYNPYTEPSMEIFSYHEGLKKWVEIGNSGMFRREMLGALGFDENVTAIAWGLSLERPTMIKYNISNIRDLVGSKVKLGTIYNQQAIF